MCVCVALSLEGSQLLRFFFLLQRHFVRRHSWLVSRCCGGEGGVGGGYQLNNGLERTNRIPLFPGPRTVPLQHTHTHTHTHTNLMYTHKFLLRWTHSHTYSLSQTHTHNISVHRAFEDTQTHSMCLGLCCYNPS